MLSRHLSSFAQIAHREKPLESNNNADDIYSERSPRANTLTSDCKIIVDFSKTSSFFRGDSPLLCIFNRNSSKCISIAIRYHLEA